MNRHIECFFLAVPDLHLLRYFAAKKKLSRWLENEYPLRVSIQFFRQAAFLLYWRAGTSLKNHST